MAPQKGNQKRKRDGRSGGSSSVEGSKKASSSRNKKDGAAKTAVNQGLLEKIPKVLRNKQLDLNEDTMLLAFRKGFKETESEHAGQYSDMVQNIKEEGLSLDAINSFLSVEEVIQCFEDGVLVVEKKQNRVDGRLFK